MMHQNIRSNFLFNLEDDGIIWHIMNSIADNDVMIVMMNKY